MFYTVYAIHSLTHDWIYVGMTDTIDRRFFQHQHGYNKSTKPYRPFALFYTEQFEDSLLARQREKYFKTAAGKRRLRRIWADFEGGITGLSNCVAR
jgi:putative endonuclease